MVLTADDCSYIL